MQGLVHLDSARILLGVSGGIAAYKTPQLVRHLCQAGAEVQVVMTRSARQFVTPTSLQAVSGRAVRDDLWDPAAEAAMGHIELARWADAVLIAPATAELLSRLAAGRADDLLCTLCLATRAPILLAPAMNQVMWQKPATQRNCATLTADGYQLLGPATGDQACGETGPGRMLEPAELAAALDAYLGQTRSLGKSLAGRHVVVTAGPTREAIDPVRFISNHSSGKQGYAMAAAAVAAGAEVTLISGPVDLAPPPGARLIKVESAREMQAAVAAHLEGCDVFIGVAAVADYRPAQATAQKIKKATERLGAGAPSPGLTLELVENPDIIAGVAARAPRPLVVGFAAETHDALLHARAKRNRKGLDLIVVNDVSDTSIGFHGDYNAVTLIWESGEETLPRQSKLDVAHAAIARIAALLSTS